MEAWTIAIALAAGLAAGSALGAEGGTTVYRWTDDNGRVHYGSHPLVDNAEVVQMENAPLSEDSARDEVERRRQRQKVLDAYQREREFKQADQAKAMHAKNERAKRCRQLQSYWRFLGLQRRLFIKEEGGERHYLNEQERAAEKERTRQAMQRACGRLPDS